MEVDNLKSQPNIEGGGELNLLQFSATFDNLNEYYLMKIKLNKISVGRLFISPTKEKY